MWASISLFSRTQDASERYEEKDKTINQSYEREFIIQSDRDKFLGKVRYDNTRLRPTRDWLGRNFLG